MTMTINGSGTITGLSAGGLPDASITSAELASGAARSNFGAGAILQVKQFAYSTVDTVSSSTATNTGCTTSITPSSSTSKILVMASVATYHVSAAINGFARISRNSNAAVSGKAADYYTSGGSGICGNINIQWLDSPSTTSAVTYTVQIGSDPAASFSINKDFNAVNNGVTYLTLIEVAA